MTSISWNLDALTRDAQAWTCVADKLATANRLMEAATVTSGDFMAFLDGDSAAAQAVADAVQELQAFVRFGEFRTREGADVLLRVRDAYRDNEEWARLQFAGLWVPDED